jgi:hypothetical protein
VRHSADLLKAPAAVVIDVFIVINGTAAERGTSHLNRIIIAVQRRDTTYLVVRTSALSGGHSSDRKIIARQGVFLDTPLYFLATI